MEIKFIILAFLVILFISAWILSKSKLSQKIKMTEKLFIGANIILLLCSIAGLIATVIIGSEVLTSHIFEILLIPALLAFVVTGVSKKSENSDELYDEKQRSDMRDAAAVSWMVLIIAAFVLYAMYAAGNITGPIFFPIILYLAFAVYSGSLLYFFKTG